MQHITTAQLDRIADIMYGRFYPDTIKRTSQGLSAYSGLPEGNPMRRGVEAALKEVLEITHHD